jgi:hypothetical protein
MPKFSHGDCPLTPSLSRKGRGRSTFDALIPQLLKITAAPDTDHLAISAVFATDISDIVRYKA